MTKEEKELLLVDLCSRLPYGVIYHRNDGANIELKEINFEKRLLNFTDDIEERECKPYLRPMSSMTEDESAELSNIISEWFDKELFYLIEEPFLEYALSIINYSISPLLFDWLNKHYFDYRGLIEKGLALEAPEGMYRKEAEK